MFQEIIVGIIGVAVICLVAYKTYKFFTTSNEQKGNCGCSSCACNPKYKEAKK